MEFAKQLQTVRDGFEVLNHPDTDLAELFGSVPCLGPDALAATLMSNLEIETFDATEKKYWLDVAIYMGPDWIEALSRAVAFMRKVEGFK